MKKNKKIIKILLVILAIICIISIDRKVDADSGWDTSYDSGYYGGYDSGGYSYSSDYSYSYNHHDYSRGNGNYRSGKTSNPIISLIMLSIIIILFALSIISNLKSDAVDIHKAISKIVPNFNEDEFCNKCFNNYKKLLDYWIKLEDKEVKNICSQKFYEIYHQALAKRKNIKEIIENIELKDYKIITVDQKTHDITIEFKFTCINYLIDTTNGNIITGNKNIKESYTSVLVFNLDNQEDPLIIFKTYGIPFFSNNSFENNIKIDINQDKYQQYELGLSIEEIKQETFNIYKSVQDAWSNFDYDNLKDLTTDELYNTYKSQLEVLKVKKQRNIMKKIKYIDSKVLDVNKDNDIVNIKMYLNIEMYDYVVDSDGKVIRGDDKHKLNVKYHITLIKNNKNYNKCPNCGEDISKLTSGKCPSCRAKIINNNYKYVMSKKECISQSKK